MTTYMVDTFNGVVSQYKVLLETDNKAIAETAFEQEIAKHEAQGEMFRALKLAQFVNCDPKYQPLRVSKSPAHWVCLYQEVPS